MLKGNWDVLTAHTGGLGLETNFARQQAALNLVKVISSSAAIMTLANAINPGSAETNPESSDFGKIKIGNTRIDYTGGASSLIVLASRLIMGKTKSTTTGDITNVGEKYGSATKFDLVVNFLAGKANPPARVVIDILKGKNINFQKPTVGSEAYTAFTPIMIQNLIQLKDDNSVQAVLGFILDGLGLNSTTYQPNQSTKKSVPDTLK